MVDNLRLVGTLDQAFGYGPARFVSYERDLRALRREIDALRRDNRRVAELYDVVFEWAKSNAAANGAAPGVNVDETNERMARVLAEHDRISPGPA
jgi:hypothetical protein